MRTPKPSKGEPCGAPARRQAGLSAWAGCLAAAASSRSGPEKAGEEARVMQTKKRAEEDMGGGGVWRAACLASGAAAAASTAEGGAKARRRCKYSRISSKKKKTRRVAGASCAQRFSANTQRLRLQEHGARQQRRAGGVSAVLWATGKGCARALLPALAWSFATCTQLLALPQHSRRCVARTPAGRLPPPAQARLKSSRSDCCQMKPPAAAVAAAPSSFTGGSSPEPCPL